MSYQYDQAVEDAASDFFRAYSRLDYILKKRDRFKAQNSDPKALWEDFASEINDQIALNTTEEFVKAKKTILKGLPCRKKILLKTDGSEKVSLNKANETYWLFLQFQMARSIIFSGGVFNGKALAGC